jgi:uncharacterized glyoxalase superfamily protein PhnB
VQQLRQEVDAFVATAEAAGAKIVQPASEHFHGDRVAVLRDRSGHTWFFATRLKEFDQQQLKQRASDRGI